MSKFKHVGSSYTRAGRKVPVFVTEERKDNPVGPLIRGYGGATPLTPPSGFEELAVQGYALNAIARAAIDKQGGFCADIPLKLQRHSAGGVWEDVDATEDDEHPLMMLLARPNPRQSYTEFVKALIGFRLLSGQAYIAANGPAPALPPTELWQLRPDWTRCIPGISGLVDTWEYRNGRGTATFDMRANAAVKPILQWKNFNPLSDWYGLPVLRAAGMQLAQHNGGAKWNANLLNNNVRPSGMLVVKDPSGNGNTTLTDPQREQVKQAYADHMSGPDNAGTPFIAEGGLEWQEMSINPKDLDWLEGMRDAARLICLVLGVPPILLNIPGDNTYKNYEEARQAAYLDSAVPLMNSLVEEFNLWLVPAYGKGLRLALDLDKVEALAEWRMARMERLDKITHLTTNEKRTKSGLPEIDDPMADEVLIPSSMVPLTEAATPEEETELDENGDPVEPEDEEDAPVAKPKPGKKPPLKMPVPKKGYSDDPLVINLLRFAAAR